MEIPTMEISTMEIVSRENIFLAPDEDDTPTLDLQLEITQVQAAAVEEPELDPEQDEFCLFGGETINVAEMNAPEQEDDFVGRPEYYYFYKSTPETRKQCQEVALIGELAAQWIERESTAPDINADYIKPKRACRPSSAARRNRKLRNDRAEQERKDTVKMQRLRRAKPKWGAFGGRGRGRGR